jgi:hypothetical protein
MKLLTALRAASGDTLFDSNGQELEYMSESNNIAPMSRGNDRSAVRANYSDYR